MAPGSPIDYDLAKRIEDVAARMYPDGKAEIHYHPQCFLSAGHFAGDDASRRQAFLDIANDDSFQALWFARGGYGACRIAADIVPNLTIAAAGKLYLGYSDVGCLLAPLYKAGFGGLAHGPMPSDIKRDGGEAAVGRALAYLVERAPETVEPTVSESARTVAFNMAVFSHLIGTPLQPDLTGHILMLEEVSEYMYKIDRLLFHITSNPNIRKVSGIMLGRCSDIPPNDPDFVQTEEDVVAYWCGKAGIPYLGRADIGHDIDNKIVPFGSLPSA
jgi:muramoyltetrapeptide carboxypeptidase